MIHLRRKDNESNESLVRRFTRSVQSISLVQTKKKRQFFQTPATRAQRRKAAQVRTMRKAQLAYLIKVGKLPVGTKSLKKK